MNARTRRPTMEKVHWKDVRKQVMEVNPTLGTIIDALDPGPEYTLIRARYPFGSKLIDNGICKIPKESGGLLPLKDHSQPRWVKEDFTYNQDGAIPMGIVLKNSVDLSLTPTNKVVPATTYETGDIFSLWSVLEEQDHFHPTRIWTMTSGSGCSFMLPKIADQHGYKQFQKTFGIRLHPPSSLTDHGNIFTKLANHSLFPEAWHSEILFFSKQWLQNDDLSWLPFQHHLLKKVWRHTKFQRNSFCMDYIWSIFIGILEKDNVRSDPFQLDVLKRIIMITLGCMPGFSPAANVQSRRGPFEAIQKVFMDIYSLRDYVPTIMCAQSLSHEELSGPVYYSTHLPMLFESLPRLKRNYTCIENLRDVVYLLKIYEKMILRDDPKVKHTEFAKRFLASKFDFFHNEYDPYELVSPTREMAKEDPRLLHCPPSPIHDQFANSAKFIQGCIKISQKDTRE